ncbi:hypothetical protein [Spiroplasma ixodetis]|uniref:hypothetical protein n=1 Tax=Spiroplasma ixodetis TaxID=2141 RepID=UPI002577B7C7|nr:hypothetical protein [Spiroplasma ixodetis]WJG71181.1 hypothetical protein SIXOD_v1c25420 [Spiroplasma ixodetis Y32]
MEYVNNINPDLIGGIIISIYIYMVVLILTIIFGVIKCKNNNHFGILLLTISLNIIGTIIGCVLLYKNQNPEFRFWKSFWNKIKKIFTFKIHFKRKSKQNNISPQS